MSMRSISRPDAPSPDVKGESEATIARVNTVDSPKPDQDSWRLAQILPTFLLSGAL